jgi:hypothetical protein
MKYKIACSKNILCCVRIQSDCKTACFENVLYCVGIQSDCKCLCDVYL